MTKVYLTLGIISIVVVATAIYAFTQVGTPGLNRALELDSNRISNLTSIKSAIQTYYTKNKILPANLDDLIKESSYSYLKIKDPETDTQYEYSVIGQNSYKLCATFATDSDDKKARRGQYRYYDYDYTNKEFKHPKGHHCFDLKVTDYRTSTTTISKPRTTTILDDKIQEVTTDAKNISSASNFPYGFFSDNSEEHGLYNNSFDPVTVTIKFKNPIKIKSILSAFGSCAYYDCTKWSVTGINSKNETEQLINETVATGRFDQGTNPNLPILVISESEFSSIKITANPKVTSHTQNLFWEKIKIGYK